MKHFILALALALGLCAPASAYPISQNHTYTDGETLTQSTLNPNFQTIYSWANGGVDNTNIGTAGIFASQIKPTSTAQATFGGTFGYLFLAPAPNVVPLTVSAIASQSADIFDVTLTSGGAKVFGISPTGNGFVGAAPVSIANSNNLVFTIARGDASAATGGALYFGNGTNAQTGSIVLGSNALQISSKNSSAGFIQVNGDGSLYAAPLINSTNVLAPLPPFYTPAGAAVASTWHGVWTQVVASGATTTITLTGAAVFANNNYTVTIQNLSLNQLVTTSIAVASGSSFSFSSTNGQIYNITCLGF